MKMITEDYVSFETAKLLKEKGFNGLCTAYYDCFTTDNFHCGNEPTDFNSIDTKIRNIVAAPTLQMAMKWLREVHNIHIEVNLGFSEDPIKYPPFYYVFILDSKSGNSIIDRAARIDGLNPLVDVNKVPRDFNTYEEACEAAINYCLEKLV